MQTLGSVQHVAKAQNVGYKWVNAPAACTQFRELKFPLLSVQSIINLIISFSQCTLTDVSLYWFIPVAFELQCFFQADEVISLSHVSEGFHWVPRARCVNSIAEYFRAARQRRRRGAVLHLTKYPREGVRLTTRDKIHDGVAYIRRPLADTGAKTDSELMRR